MDDPYNEEDWDDNYLKLPYEYKTNLIIRDPIQPRVYKNIYKIVIENMHGDADMFSYITLYLDEKDIINIVDFCAWLNIKYLRDNVIEKVYYKVFKEKINFMVGDATCDGQRLASPRVQKITYFDENGVEHEVRINSIKIR